MSTTERLKRMCNTGIFDNTVENALPQTVVAKIIEDHIKRTGNPKVLVYGLDGVRADCCPALLQEGGASYIRKNGTNLLTYAGGDPKHPETLQKTCTWQGWAAIQTGVWGNENGVWDFFVLRRDCPTVLMKEARRGKKCFFTVVWPEHCNVTYRDEIRMAREENLDFKHRICANEDTLFHSVLDAVDNGTDIIFAIVDYTDHVGHTSGFSIENTAYTDEIKRRDMQALETIKHIESRPEFEKENWLYIMTTDHGGHQCTHFEQSLDDRMTFLTVNKKI